MLLEVQQQEQGYIRMGINKYFDIANKDFDILEGFCCKWGGTLEHLIAIGSAEWYYRLWFELEVIRVLLVVNFNFKTKPGRGCGRTFFKCPTIGNTCSLAAIPHFLHEQK